jgi:hypothetical protein
VAYRHCIFVVTVFAVSAGVLPAAAAEWSLNVFGLSYHPDRSRARTNGFDNEINPGLGLRYELSAAGAAHVFMLEADVYRDSKRATAKAAGVGYQYRLTERLRAGAALVLFHSRSYNDGDVFVTPLPIVTYRFDKFALNVTYSPRISGVNEVAAFGFYLSIPLPGTK